MLSGNIIYTNPKNYNIFNYSVISYHNKIITSNNVIIKNIPVKYLYILFYDNNLIDSTNDIDDFPSIFYHENNTNRLNRLKNNYNISDTKKCKLYKFNTETLDLIIEY